jgi:hypothetical protein
MCQTRHRKTKMMKYCCYILIIIVIMCNFVVVTMGQLDMGCTIDETSPNNGGCGPHSKCISIPIMHHVTGKTVYRNICVDNEDMEATINTIKTKHSQLSQSVPWQTTSDYAAGAVMATSEGKSQESLYAAYAFPAINILPESPKLLNVLDIEDFASVEAMVVEDESLDENEAFEFVENDYQDNDYQD